ncbi:methyl-accepting chemotaxis protein [Cedecea sp. USHLN005]|uniref:methyl-accepting chemotaxis protein n=1 Tax=Cedecea sp. USHLN005 TaxID=3081239 RepID=UPI00301B0202
MFKNLSVGSRISGSFIIILLTLIMLTLVAIMQVNKINNALIAINDVNNVKQRYAVNFRGSVHDRSIAIHDVTLVPAGELQGIVEHIRKLEQDYQASVQPMESIFAQGSDVTPEERTQYEKIKEAEQQTLPLVNEIIALQQKGDVEGARQVILNQARPAFVNWLATINGFIDMETQLNDTLANTARGIARTFHLLMLTLALVAVAIGLLITWSTTRKITLSLGGEPVDLLRMTNAIAAGDLTQTPELRKKDSSSILASLSHMQNALRQLVLEVRQNAEGVASASAEIAKGSSSLSARTENQAAALQQTSAAMDQVASTVRNNAESAQYASKLASSAASEVTQGSEMVQGIVSTMEEITQESVRIADITSVIEGIAFQTNILALNAAVEAARAGEQGRGFAVVATEVRALAQRSSSAAKEIKGLITGSVQRVNSGAQEIDQAAETMIKILTTVSQVNSIVNEIAHNSAEQATGVNEVAQAVAQMDKNLQQNVALVEVTSSTATSLDRQSRVLRETVSVFQVAS